MTYPRVERGRPSLNSDPNSTVPASADTVVTCAALASSTPTAEADRPLAKKEVDPRMHSAEHILTRTLMAMFGCGRPFTTHLEKKKSKADYRFARALTPGEEQEVERQVNAVVAANLAVWEELLPRSEAARLHDLQRLPDAAEETIRIIHIGDYDACPCSGQHVSSTQEVGVFRVVSTTFQEGALRVRFKLEQ